MASSPAFDSERFRQALRTEYLARRDFFLLESTTSTNDVAREHIDQPGFVVLAEQQTSGRGTHGRTWESPPGQDLYCSLVLHFPQHFAQLGWLSLTVGLALHDAISDELAATKSRARIKWPNDIWIERDDGSARKCAGVLVESTTSAAGTRAVVGFGVNVLRQQFSSELNGRATSIALESELQGPFVRERILANILAALEQRLGNLIGGKSTAVYDAVKVNLLWCNQPARLDHAPGIVRGIAISGALLFERDGAITEVFSGHLAEASEP